MCHTSSTDILIVSKQGAVMQSGEIQKDFLEKGIFNWILKKDQKISVDRNEVIPISSNKGKMQSKR